MNKKFSVQNVFLETSKSQKPKKFLCLSKLSSTKNSFISFKYLNSTHLLSELLSSWDVPRLEPIKKQYRNKPKMEWLSKNKLAFEWETTFGKDFPWGYQVVGKKRVLVIAEAGKNLLFFGMGENSGYSGQDILCCFCGNSITFGGRGIAPTCSVGKLILGVKFCRDFAIGPPFGEDTTKDTGERREIVEQILPKIEWDHCDYCKFLNSENVIKFFGDGEGFITEDPAARFCEILLKLPEPGYWRVCKNFVVSQEPETRARYEDKKRWLHDYLGELKELEKQTAEKIRKC